MILLAIPPPIVTAISILFKVGHHASHIIHVTHARPFGLLCPEAISYTYARLATTPYVIFCCVMQGHIIYICQACYTHLM